MNHIVAAMRVAFLGCIATAVAIEQRSNANPIRKVVNMLEALKGKVEAEGEKEKELFDKYMCYCKNAGGDLAKSIADAEKRGPELTSEIEASTGKLAQLKEDVKAHQTDRAAAKAAMAEATSLREKEKAAFDSEKSESETNIAAIGKATAAIEKGMGSFLQSTSASLLKKIVMSRNLMDADRQDVLAFLSGSSDYAPASGEITGILKTMGDEMKADLKDAVAKEADAVAAYEELMTAKKKEVNALTKMIEAKLGRIGDLGVAIQQMKNDLGDTAEGLLEDKKFLADLDKNCEEKQKLNAENVKYRTQELAALSDTIKILNDDDALELFKKTLPGASSFAQVDVTSQVMRSRAIALIQSARGQSNRRPQLDFISLALRGKKIGFGKVLKMIEDLVAELKQDQVNDDGKKEYCNTELDTADDKKKVLEKSQSDLETSIVDAKEGITSTKAEIEALDDGIKALDKSVAEATEQRKEENEDYTALMASDAAAKELIEFAKNRLNKFYNPKLYKAPAGGFAQVHAHSGEAPPPPPEEPKKYQKSGEESNGIIAMMDALVKDLDKEMTEAELTEKDAQGDYEAMMKDSAEKRAEDSKAMTDKQGALAELETSLGQSKEDLASTKKELGATIQYIDTLHTECDFILKYFDMRKEARAGEIDSLEKAVAVLNGADYSLVQTRSTKFLQK
jgi:chromosome segregation ATPase